MGLTDEATQKVRPPLRGISDSNTRLAVLQRTAKVKGHHTEEKNDTLVLCLCSQDELRARERTVKMSKKKDSERVRKGKEL